MRRSLRLRRHCRSSMASTHRTLGAAARSSGRDPHMKKKRNRQRNLARRRCPTSKGGSSTGTSTAVELICRSTDGTGTLGASRRSEAVAVIPRVPAGQRRRPASECRRECERTL